MAINIGGNPTVNADTLEGNNAADLPLSNAVIAALAEKLNQEEVQDLMSTTTVTFGEEIRVQGGIDTNTNTDIAMRRAGVAKLNIGDADTRSYNDFSIQKLNPAVTFKNISNSTIGYLVGIDTGNQLQMITQDGTQAQTWDNTDIRMNKPLKVQGNQVEATKFIQTANAGNTLYSIEVSRPGTQIYNPAGQVGIGTSSSKKELEVTSTQIITTVPVLSQGNPLVQGIGGVKKIEKVVTMPGTPDPDTLYIVTG